MKKKIICFFSKQILRQKKKIICFSKFWKRKKKIFFRTNRRNLFFNFAKEKKTLENVTKVNCPWTLIFQLLEIILSNCERGKNYELRKNLETFYSHFTCLSWPGGWTGGDFAGCRRLRQNEAFCNWPVSQGCLGVFYFTSVQ